MAHPPPCPAPRCSTGGQEQLRRQARCAHLDCQQRGLPSGTQFKSGTQPSTADGTQELLLRAEAKKKASGGGRRGEHGAGATTQKPARGARRTPQGGGSGLCSAPRRHTNAAHRRAQGLRRHCEGREIHGIVIDTTKLSAGERVHQPKRGTLDGGGIARASSQICTTAACPRSRARAPTPAHQRAAEEDTR